MTCADPVLHNAADSWLDASIRQIVVELALAGAHHGMHSQARVILHALPSLVTDRETRQWLHSALLIALGDTRAARAHLAKIVAAGHDANPTGDVLARWLDAMDASQSANAMSPTSRALSSSSSSSPPVPSS
ncbi:DUF1039 domain-containing protein [Pandoraea cepalis]|uniref:Type III secretion apparatus n=1 Tax=Pandoraea cepalis TaxID=2508294 RepID=A0A5E4SM19_9BURK|nr:DUF1039 domain-containing protein [Pandoraea cepalis]VVD76787.1 type III secretion apparatus [Pandoraea cepalis]